MGSNEQTERRVMSDDRGIGSAAARAATLVEALPYIRQFYGRTLVIKYGGNAMTSEALKAMVMQDVALLHYVGIRPILVHGGGPEISNLMGRLGHEPTFVRGLRVTDAPTMEIVEMALAGKTNKGIVALLNAHGARAVGLSGKDANLLMARKLQSDDGDLGFVGEITRVQPDLLRLLADQGYVPVLCSVAIGDDGATYNVNADHAAGAVAAAVGAEKLILLTDIEGLRSCADDPDSLISEMDADGARGMLASGAADRGMIPKLEACLMALEAGVPRAHLIDGRVPHALLIEVFTDSGIGTMIGP